MVKFIDVYFNCRDLEIRNSDIVRQMNADIFRTVAEKDQTQHVENMKTVLLAYAEYNPKLGYCQGLNFIAEKLVRFTNQENAFWLLVQMIDQFPSDYYTTMVFILRVTYDFKLTIILVWYCCRSKGFFRLIQYLQRPSQCAFAGTYYNCIV